MKRFSDYKNFFLSPTSSTNQTRLLRSPDSIPRHRHDEVPRFQTRNHITDLRLRIKLLGSLDSVPRRRHELGFALTRSASRRTPFQRCGPGLGSTSSTVPTSPPRLRRTPCQRCGPAGTDLWHGGGRTACQQYAVVRRSRVWHGVRRGAAPEEPNSGPHHWHDVQRGDAVIYC